MMAFRALGMLGGVLARVCWVECGDGAVGLEWVGPLRYNRFAVTQGGLVLVASQALREGLSEVGPLRYNRFAATQGGLFLVASLPLREGLSVVASLPLRERRRVG
jgi:hypothetical protein